ncbi:MAG: Lamin Tail Domain, partial [Planctomycetota bacterium]
MRYSLLSALVVTSVTIPAAHAGIVITEVMSSSGTNGTPDWIEVTNDGSSAVSLTGWKM